MASCTPGFPVFHHLSVCSNSWLLNQWCHPTNSSSVELFSSHLQSFPESGYFPMRQFLTLGSQSIGGSTSASVLPMNIQDWFSLGNPFDWFDLAVQETLKNLLQHYSSKASVFDAQPSLWLNPRMTIGKTIASTRLTFVGKVTSLLLSMPSRFVIAFLPRGKWLVPTQSEFLSVQFSHSVVSYSLWPHGPQHTRPPSPSPTPRVYPNSCPLSRWYHPTISSSVIPFSSCPQSFPASGSFQMSQFFTSGGSSIGVSASASVLPMNTQD